MYAVHASRLIDQEKCGAVLVRYGWVISTHQRRSNIKRLESVCVARSQHHTDYLTIR